MLKFFNEKNHLMQRELNEYFNATQNYFDVDEK